MQLVVPDDQLAKAIGRRGQNVRLAAQLTGWRIDIYSESRHVAMLDAARDEIGRIQELTDEQIDDLVRAGFQSAQEIADADPGELAQILGISDEDGQGIADGADRVVDALIMEEAARRKKGAEAPAGD